MDFPSEEINIHENEKIIVKGDVIGDTAYSERYVINILIKLLKIESLNEEDMVKFIEEDLCVLWDMTTEKDVAEFIIDNYALETFNHTLQNTDNTRLAEVIIGTAANMCSHEKVIQAFETKPNIKKIVFNYIACGDSSVIIQVLRFIFSNVYYNSSNFNSWINLFVENDFLSTFSFILTNSMNKEVLLNVFETVNCICSCINTSIDNTLLVKTLLNETFVSALITGFHELIKSLIEVQECSERCDLVFLSINSNLVNYGKYSEVAYENVKIELSEIVNNIVMKYQEDENVIVDVVQYIETLSIYFTKNLDIKDSRQMFLNILLLWTNIRHSRQTSSEFDSNVLFEELENTLPIIFAKNIRLVSINKLQHIFNISHFKQLSSLSSRIVEMMNLKTIEKSLGNVAVLNIESIINEFPGGD